MDFEVNLIHMFPIHLHLTHQNVVFEQLCDGQEVILKAPFLEIGCCGLPREKRLSPQRFKFYLKLRNGKVWAKFGLMLSHYS